MELRKQRILRKLDDTQRFRLIERQNQLLMLACALLVVIAGISLYRAVKNYADVSNCIHQNQQYYTQHKCGAVLSVD